MHKYSQPFRLEELMFLVVMLIASTMMDMVVADWNKAARAGCLAILLIFFTVAMVLYLANIFSSDSEGREILLACGETLACLAALSTVVIQLSLNHPDTVKEHE
jgi:hypothetical protein